MHSLFNTVARNSFGMQSVYNRRLVPLRRTIVPHCFGGITAAEYDSLFLCFQILGGVSCVVALWRKNGRLKTQTHL